MSSGESKGVYLINDSVGVKPLTLDLNHAERLLQMPKNGGWKLPEDSLYKLTADGLIKKSSTGNTKKSRKQAADK